MRTLYGTQQPPLNACETDLNLAPCFSPIDFLGGLDSKESACNAGDPGSIPGSGRSPGEGNGLPGESHGQRSLEGQRPWVTKSRM